MRVCSFGERFAGAVTAFLAVLTVPSYAAFLDSNQQKARMAMPTGTPAWPDHKILNVELRLAMVFKSDTPIVSDPDLLPERSGWCPLSQYHIGHDACSRGCSSNSDQQSACTDQGEQCSPG